MPSLTAYDIVDDKRRTRVASILLDYGTRVQESVFWLDIDGELQERMMRRLRSAIDAQEDTLWVIPVCQRCAKEVVTLGVTRKPETPEYWVL